MVRVRGQRIRLGGLEPSDVQVPLYHGALPGSIDLQPGDDEIVDGQSTPMELIERNGSRRPTAPARCAGRPAGLSPPARAWALPAGWLDAIAVRK